MINEQNYKRDVTFTCDNLTLWEGIFLKQIVESFNTGRIIHLESDEEFQKRMEQKVNDCI